MLILEKIFGIIQRIFKNKKIIAPNKRKGKKKLSSVGLKNQLKRKDVKNKNVRVNSIKKQKIPNKIVGKVKKSNVKVSHRSRQTLESRNRGVPIGEITHYFDKIKVCVVRIDSGTLKKGDKIIIESKNSSWVQTVTSMQIENENVAIARRGQLIGIKINKEVSIGAKVSLIQ